MARPPVDFVDHILREGSEEPRAKREQASDKSISSILRGEQDRAGERIGVGQFVRRDQIRERDEFRFQRREIRDQAIHHVDRKCRRRRLRIGNGAE